MSDTVSDNINILKMGVGQGQNITHAWCKTDSVCTVHKHIAEYKSNLKVDNQNHKTKVDSKN